jgi:hypothetical protein
MQRGQLPRAAMISYLRQRAEGGCALITGEGTDLDHPTCSGSMPPISHVALIANNLLQLHRQTRSELWRAQTDFCREDPHAFSAQPC